MSRFGVIVMGPAGAGKSTFCAALLQHLRTERRSAVYINLDPAADSFVFQPDVDIKELISLDDVMEEMSLGPNGGLIYCFEYLLDNLDFLTDPLDSVSDDYLIVIDMPGQIELYTHVPVVPALVKELTGGSLNVNLCAAYLLESTFVADRPKFFSGTLSAMSSMLMLELPHINVLSKMDLIKDTVPRKDMKRFVDPTAELLHEDPVDAVTFDTAGDETEDPAAKENVLGGASFKRLNLAVAGLIEEFGMVSFLKLDVQDEDSVGAILSHIDDAIQFHEAQEPREPADDIEME